MGTPKLTKLTGPQFEKWQAAFIDAFDIDSLRSMVRTKLGERLDTISKDSNLKVVVYELIGWAERTGNLNRLLDGAVAAVPGNDALQTLVVDAQVAVCQPEKPVKVPPIVVAKLTVEPADIAAQLDIEWITIPAGEFLMGSDKTKDMQASDPETPQHNVNLPAFRIAKYPITNALYIQFVKATAHAVPQHRNKAEIPAGKENHPVVNIVGFRVVSPGGGYVGV